MEKNCVLNARAEIDLVHGKCQPGTGDLAGVRELRESRLGTEGGRAMPVGIMESRGHQTRDPREAADWSCGVPETMVRRSWFFHFD